MPAAADHAARAAVPARAALLSFALAAFAGPATAADSLRELGAMSLDSLLDVEVSAASKFRQRIDASASSATVIGAAELRALGHRTLAEALATIRGLSTGSDRTYAFLGVRGLAAPGDYNTRVLLLIDGIRVNDTVYDQALIGSEFPLDLEQVERIEFIPGQGSAVHGANALFGVINVVTRKMDVRNTARAAVAIGSGRSGSASAMLDLAGDEGRGLLLAASGTRSDGRDLYFAGFDTPQTNHGLSRGADGERAGKLLLKLDAGHGLSGTLIHADRSKGIPAAVSTIFGDPRNRYHDDNTLASLAWTGALDAASEVSARLYAGEYRFEGDYAVDYAPGSLNVDTARATWWGWETSAVTTRFAGHKLALGADLQWSPHRDQQNYDATAPGTVYLDERRRGRRVSLFVEDQIEIGAQLAFTAGARYDRSSDGALLHSAVSPRLAAIYRPDDRTVLKYIYGTAFRPPNAYETGYTVPGAPDYRGNPALRNESVQGHEIALDFRPDAAQHWQASIYANRARDLIVQSADPQGGALMFRNQGSLRTHGLEVEGERVLANGARLRANYSLQYARSADIDEADNAAPRQMGHLIAIWPLGARWTLGLHTALMGRRAAAAGYGATSLTLATSTPWQGWGASFSVHDLFDRHADDPGRDARFIPAVPQDGRSLRLAVERSF